MTFALIPDSLERQKALHSPLLSSKKLKKGKIKMALG